jgi:hypothetical protein
MAALKINVSDDLKSRLHERAKSSGFSSPEHYVEAMVIADLAGPEMNDQQIEALLLSRIDGPFVEVDHADFEQMRRKLRKRLDAGGRSRKK